MRLRGGGRGNARCTSPRTVQYQAILCIFNMHDFGRSIANLQRKWKGLILRAVVLRRNYVGHTAELNAHAAYAAVLGVVVCLKPETRSYASEKWPF